MATFEQTKQFLASAGLRTITLKREASEGCLLIAPDLSARIMAVSMDGAADENFGFVKPEAIANRGKDPQFNAYGGALRWWVGPEGGQYGVAFPPGTENFDLNSWYISEEYNGKPFAVAYPQQEAGTSALMGTEFSVRNTIGTRFNIGVTSRISLIGNSLMNSRSKNKNRQPRLKHLGYLSETTFENLSSEPMRKETGLLSIWMLGMYVAGQRTYVIAPFERRGIGRIVTDTYFNAGGIGGNRLIVNEKSGYLLFRADAKERSKIGLSRSSASSVIGSMDVSRNLLTVWRFPIRRSMPYVNSLWEQQKRPYAGDVSNSYNDDGKFGNFYELECSSHALALKPGERFSFPLEIHHYRGSGETLHSLADKLFRRRIDRGGLC
ncbi:hypothetical protein HZA56_06055 [Candidatus Poribacteria bacterium]|nr:hypothetical protein [Candidatus Poribacteria bacterium]